MRVVVAVAARLCKTGEMYVAWTHRSGTCRITRVDVSVPDALAGELIRRAVVEWQATKLEVDRLGELYEVYRREYEAVEQANAPKMVDQAALPLEEKAPAVEVTA